ncbi:TetR/AcrR family transcriptional regulator [Flexivirga oryzae]|uniref:AcrR family transcriptional regulator n=1 Tax=Flexivirga oryzae TaxID=1794944 RepID=A0A839N400_9MICO|nr:TetR/AcrR family transcriptional regulator [Flexivirga oryzae]MBB2890784.1 AcrR family transcriptional regulator [Flexivirga oryzae]
MSSARTYSSPLRARQAADTRQAVLAAARRLFADTGYAATTVKQIADAAGVSAPTVYNGFTSKAGIAQALIDYTNQESGAQEMARDVAAARTPQDMLRASVHLVCVLHERIGDFIRVLLEAASVDAALLPAVAAGRASHAGPQQLLARRLDEAGALRPEVSRDTAAGLLTVSTSPDTIERYVADLGWDYDRIEEQLTDAMVLALCRPDMARQPCLPPLRGRPDA